MSLITVMKAATMRVMEVAVTWSFKRQLLACCVVAVWGFVMPIQAGYARDENPPEVKALVGMKLHSTTEGEIPGWKSKRATLLHFSMGQPLVLSVGEIYRGKEFVFVVYLLDRENASATILDAQVLPANWLAYSVRKGELYFRKESENKYSFETVCEDSAHHKTVVALMRPEPGQEICTHHSRQIKHAWEIDEKTGRISDVSTQGISCFWETDGYCR